MTFMVRAQRSGDLKSVKKLYQNRVQNGNTNINHHMNNSILCYLMGLTQHRLI